MTIEIILTRGAIALVDDIDIDLSFSKWYLSSMGYARRHIATGHIEIHRIVLSRKLGRDLLDGEYCDHIDGDTLNNTRENLRIATPTQNVINTRAKGTRHYKGVFARGQRWIAAVQTGGTFFYLGTFANEELAAHAYDKKARELFGEYARTNFPLETK